MTAFVILAGGRGTRIGRVGESLHKCLVPLNGKAIISHQIALAPLDARIIINTGYRADQIREYITLAHPDRHVTFVHTEDWDQPGAGPGTGLTACREYIDDGDDMIFTSCDTLWSPIKWDYDPRHPSWVAVAPVPAGTPPARWCRFVVNQWVVLDILDKDPKIAESVTYTGMAYIAACDLPLFWSGITEGNLTAGELQITGGFYTLLHGRLSHRRIDWTDVGDEESYKHAVSRHSGFDWTKLDQATYVLPETGRVVKFHSDQKLILERVTRGELLKDLVPQPITQVEPYTMLSYPYVAGISAYDACEVSVGVMQDLIAWWNEHIWSTRTLTYDHQIASAMRFYRDKTFERIQMLSPTMRARALDEVTRIDWPTLVNGIIPGNWHGDFNAGNVIVPDPLRYEMKNRSLTGLSFVSIDWRENFAGEFDYGDLRYDLAKLLAGTVVHWDNARRGDFRPWDDGPRYAAEIRKYICTIVTENAAQHIEIIGALSLLNSSPLHASPLDEILVSRGVSWLEEIL